MFKNFKKRLTGLFASILMLTALSSCSSSFFKTKNIIIDDVVTVINNDGDLVVTITFVDDVKAPLTFTVPQGEAGNGIANIIQAPKPDGSGTIVTITYTDETIPPLTFEIANGVSIAAVTSAQDPNYPDKTIMKITLSNGETIQFVLDRPVDGKDGNSIVGITQELNPEDNSITLTIHFSETDDIVVTIPAGLQGTSVTGITMQLSPDGDYYVYTFIMSDGSFKTISVSRPATWHSGTGRPNTDFGMEGDFYYARDLNVIYYRTAVGWIVQFDLNEVKAEPTIYTVTFDLNANSAPWPGWQVGTMFPTGESGVYYIEHGHTFYDTYYDEPYGIPVPIRDGYNFEGWYTHKTPNVNSTRFGDLISIYRDMTLYANWVEI